MKINPKNFRVQGGERIKLEKWPTLVELAYQSTQRYRELLGKRSGSHLYRNGTRIIKADANRRQELLAIRKRLMQEVPSRNQVESKGSDYD
jgi:hypothetical protein